MGMEDEEVKFTKRNFEGLQARIQELESRPTLGSALTEEQVEAAAKAWFEAANHEQRWETDADCISDRYFMRAALSTIVLPARGVSDEELEDVYFTAAIGEDENPSIRGLRAVLALGNDVYPAPATTPRDYAHKAFHRETVEGLEARVAELEKERDLWKEKHASVDAAVGVLHGRIADLTKPRVVDEALVEEMAEKVPLYVGGISLTPDSRRYLSRAILAALPANLAPVELMEEECDRLQAVYNEEWEKDHILNADSHADIRAVRALLAAAGRYVQPVSAGPATDSDIQTTYEDGHAFERDHGSGLRAVYNLGRKDGRSEEKNATGALADAFLARAGRAEEALAKFTPWTQTEEHVADAADAIRAYPYYGITMAGAVDMARAALATLPKLYTAGSAKEHTLDERLDAQAKASGLDEPEARLPFVGLDSGEVDSLRDAIDRHLFVKSLRILARAMGVE